MWKGRDWKMLFGIENEYHTNSSYYEEQLLQFDIPYAIIEASQQFGGFTDAYQIDLEKIKGRDNMELATKLHELAIEKRRYRGFTGYRLPNRMRIYVDMLHPEISTAECTNPRDLLLQQKAGEYMIEAMRRSATEKLGLQNDPILICKNNSSGFKNKRKPVFGGQYTSWATHENYLVPPDLFDEFVAKNSCSERTNTWLAFLVSKIYGGSGKIGSESENANPCDYQIFQRADFISRLKGMETTESRALINTRDNPYADWEKYRRLHVICGDALIAPWSIYVTYGATALVLKMLAEGFPLPQFSLKDPVKAYHEISRDLTGKKRVIELSGEKKNISALEIQQQFLASMQEYVLETGNETFREAVQKLGFVLQLFDADPERLKFYLDFAIKKEYLDMAREGTTMSRDELHLESLEYHNMNPEEGIYLALEREGFPDGEIMGIGSSQSIVTREEILRATMNPPQDSRAYFGGEIVRKFPEEIVQLSWYELHYLVHKNGGTEKKVVSYEPWFGTKEHIGPLLETSASLEELLSRIEASS